MEPESKSPPQRGNTHLNLVLDVRAASTCLRCLSVCDVREENLTAGPQCDSKEISDTYTTAARGTSCLYCVSATSKLIAKPFISTEQFNDKLCATS